MKREEVINQIKEEITNQFDNVDNLTKEDKEELFGFDSLKDMTNKFINSVEDILNDKLTDEEILDIKLHQYQSLTNKLILG